jgi:hypothetical protein
MPTTIALAVDRIQTDLDDESVEFFVGRKFLKRHEQPRRIVWVPVQSPIEPPQGGGGELTPDGKSRLVICCTRVDVAEALIFDTELECVDELFDELLAAFYRTEANPITPGPWEWVTEMESKAGETIRCNVIRCRFQFRKRVPEEKADLKLITAQEHTCNLVVDLSP